MPFAMRKKSRVALNQQRYRDMTDQIEWRVYEDHRLFPCPVCQQPVYQKARLGRFGHTLNLNDWGCSRCKKMVTLNTDDLTTQADMLAPQRSV